MPMPPYAVLCTTGGCRKPAVYKIAARWSDGLTGELKTYALCCADCLLASFRASRAKQAKCRTAPGETLEPPGVYEIARGCRDTKLLHREDLERELTAAPDSPSA
jgi:hypothetical protein